MQYPLAIVLQQSGLLQRLVHDSGDSISPWFTPRVRHNPVLLRSKAISGLSGIICAAARIANDGQDPYRWPAHHRTIDHSCSHYRCTPLRHILTSATVSIQGPRGLKFFLFNGTTLAAREAHSNEGHSSASLCRKEHQRCPKPSQFNGALPSCALKAASTSNWNSISTALWDGSYPVYDQTTGANTFVEFSVESVREALQRGASCINAKDYDEMLEGCQVAGSASGGYASDGKNKPAAKGGPITTVKRRGKRKTSGLFGAMHDDELANLLPDGLSTQQLLYVLGRACFLSNPIRNNSWCLENKTPASFSMQPEQWMSLFKSLRGRIHEMGPLEITRACQALAYAKKVIERLAPGVDSDVKSTAETAFQCSSWKLAQAECCAAFEEMQRTIATCVHRLHGDCLSRVIYASLKGGFPENAGFIEFICAEVISRLNKLRPWHVFRVFQPSVCSNAVGNDFLISIARHLVKSLAYLPAESISALVPALVKLRIFDSPNHLAKLNVIAGKRFRGLTDSILLVRLGEPMLSHNLLTPVNVAALLKGLERTKTPTNYSPRKLLGSTDEHPSGDDAATGGHTTHAASVDVMAIHNVNKVLLPLKLIEMCVRHDHSKIFKALSPKIGSLLERAQAAQVKLTCFAPPLEQQHVNAALLRIVAAEYHLHPSVYGPFLLELSDPLSRVTVEWDMPWLFFPVWNQFTQRTYALQKQRYLRAEGWEVILLPLDTYLEQKDAVSKERYLINTSRERIPEGLRRRHR